MSADSSARVRRVALTGGIGTGKSTVLGAFAARGVPTIDADTLSRAVVAPGTPGLAAIAARFGPGVIATTGALDRAALARVVFSDAAARRDLEAIVHPPVRAAIDQWFDSLDPVEHAFAIADVPLLFETGRDAQFDTVIVAAVAPATQLARVMARDNASAEDVRRRIDAQLPLDDKVRRADYVVHTDGTREDVAAQVEQLYQRLGKAPGSRLPPSGMPS
jgi:dephospho-CoA kinase